jgi:hypothetical protein
LDIEGLRTRTTKRSKQSVVPKRTRSNEGNKLKEEREDIERIDNPVMKL